LSRLTAGEDFDNWLTNRFTRLSEEILLARGLLLLFPLKAFGVDPDWKGKMATVMHMRLDASERALVRLLSQHYGDRSLYLSHPRDHLVLRDAMERGYVSSDGELTPAGYAFWQRNE